jgi:hypothetical protein
MSGILISILILIAVALVIVWAAERFSPDPLLTKIIQLVVFVVVLVVMIKKLLPLM